MKRSFYLPLSVLFSFAAGVYVVLSLSLELSVTKVVITGIAIQLVTYFAALLRDDLTLAEKQQRTLRDSRLFLQIAIVGSTLGMGLFTLGMAISFIPHPWAGVATTMLLGVTDSIVVIASVLLVTVNGNILRPVANIAQHEYAVVGTSTVEPVLRTRNVRWCTAWYGWDSEHRVAFMAHFDRPASARDIKPIVDEILQHVSPGATLHTVVEGGYRTRLFGWRLLRVLNLSYNTRQTLKAALNEESRLSITLIEGAYTLDGAHARHKTGLPSSHGRFARDISLHTDTYTVSYELLTGDKLPKRPFMRQPMLKSDKIK